MATFQQSNKYPRVFGPMKDVRANDPLTFPQLSQGSYGKIITRHFMNLHFTLHGDPLSLLCFLIYHSGKDNTLVYSMKLLKQYDKAVSLAQERWGAKKIARSLPTARRSFKILIEKGIIIHIEKKNYLVNPILTFSKKYVKQSFWAEFVKEEISSARAKEYINHVEINYRKTKQAA